MGNMITTFGGFALASRGNIDLGLLLATLLGLAFVIASACVVNNYTDREIDKKMERTKNRAFVKGVVLEKHALLFAALLGVLGFSVLISFTNTLTTLIALFGFFVYLVLYAILKRLSIHGTFIGSIAGAVPPVVGYCAVSNHFDLAACLLFLILVFWQMPHFFAIALYRFQDYRAASIPVLPIKRGLQTTKIYSQFYIVIFLLAAISLTFFGYTGYGYLVIASLLGLTWFFLAMRNLTEENSVIWARKMFRFSLVVITILFMAISLDGATETFLS